MADFEFTAGSADAEGFEELLEPGPRRTVPRWLIAAAVVIAAAAVVLFAVDRDDSSKQPAAAVSPPIPAASSSTPAPYAPGFGVPLDLGPGAALDVAVSGAARWVLQDRAIHAVDSVGKRHDVRIPGAPLVGSTDAVATLEPDPASGTIWVVVLGVKKGRALQYDATSLRLIREVDAIGFLDGATSMRGHLYVLRGGDLIDVAPQGEPVTMMTVKGALGSIVADDVHSRLLVADYGNPTRVWAVYPAASGGGIPQVSPPVRIRVTKATLAVSISGEIWLAGFDTGDGVLMELAPDTLLPATHSGLDIYLEPGAVLVGAGLFVIWVRPSGGAQLQCIDAENGRQLQTWEIEGPVASGNNVALVATEDSGAVPLQLARCRG